MKQRPIGTATVTAIGSGDVCLATAAARGIDARDVARALHEALELGISLVDVADEEAAERLCGEAVRELRLRDRVIVATRVPVLPPKPGGSRDALPARLPAAYVQERIEASLRTTRLDALPLAQLPLRADWRAASAWPELVGTCARLVREGKVLQWGARVDHLDGAPELVAESWLSSIQVAFNLCARDADPILAAAAGKLAILARTPLAGGALAGSLGPGVKLALHDDRRTLDEATLERIAVGLGHVANLVEREPPAIRACAPARAVVENAIRPDYFEAITTGELALRYVVDRDTIALPRLHRRDHLAEIVAIASARPLSPDLRSRLEERFPKRDPGESLKRDDT